MAVIYKLYQNNMSNFKNKGKWYARAMHTGTVDIDALADIMQDNCTVKRSDIVAVLSELVETMTTQLQNSMKVKLDRLGTFKLGVISSGAETASDFSPRKNIVGLRVIFYPETKIDATGNRIKALVSGTSVKEASEYVVDDQAADSSDSTDSTGDGN